MVQPTARYLRLALAQREEVNLQKVTSRLARFWKGLLAEESEKSGAQSAIILAAVVVGVAVVSVMFGLQTLVWLNAKHWASVDPWLDDTPEPVHAAGFVAPERAVPVDKKGKPIRPPQVRAYDYEFAQPWPGNVKTTPAQSFVEFHFDSGQVIAFLDPGAQVDVVRQMKSSETPLYAPFQNVFGSEVPETNYDLYRVVYSASPKQISPFMRSQEAFRANVLILWKLSFGFDAQPHVYSIRAGSNRGFQFGNPSANRPVALRLFDGADKQLRLIFTVGPGSSGAFTQDDIDQVVVSLRPVPILER